MAWYFSTSTSVATMLGMQPCVSSCQWVNILTGQEECITKVTCPRIVQLGLMTKHICSSENWVVSDSGYGLLPVQLQAIA